MSNEPSAPERVQSAFRKLSASASGLNTASDELGKTITELDAALKKLNLGISAWVVITASSGNDPNFWARSIGYAKVGNDWGIALRESTGNENWEADEQEIWLFNDAPRWMRIEGIGKILDLLESLAKQADETTEKVKKKTAEAKELAAAIKTATAEPKATMPLSALGGIRSATKEAVPLSSLASASTAESVTKARK